MDSDTLLDQIVQIPEEMLLSSEEYDDIQGEEENESTSEQDTVKQIRKADKRIDSFEETIRRRIQQSQEQQDDDNDIFMANISDPKQPLQHRKVVTVQPIASYDEIFSSPEQLTGNLNIEKEIEVQTEPSEQKSADELIFVGHEHSKVNTKIKTEPIESPTSMIHPSVKRTITLKNILKALKQPEPKTICGPKITSHSATSTLSKPQPTCISRHETISQSATSTLSKTVVHEEVQSFPAKARNVEVGDVHKHGKIAKMFSQQKVTCPGKAVRKPVQMNQSANPAINIVDITGQLKLANQSETPVVHTVGSDKVMVDTKSQHDIVKPKERLPVQIEVHGNIDKQTTIQGNVENLTIQHVTTASAMDQVHPAITVTAPSELSVHVPVTQRKTQSQLAMEYKPCERMKGKQVVSVQRTVHRDIIPPPIPPSQQSDQYYYCDKCDKKFRSKSYYRTHIRRLCEALENPEALVCKTCGKLFRHEKNYRDHLGVHDGIKRFVCRRCGEKFLRESELVKHRRECRV